jgi:hypothetical protein
MHAGNGLGAAGAASLALVLAKMTTQLLSLNIGCASPCHRRHRWWDCVAHGIPARHRGDGRAIPDELRVALVTKEVGWMRVAGATGC